MERGRGVIARRTHRPPDRRAHLLAACASLVLAFALTSCASQRAKPPATTPEPAPAPAPAPAPPTTTTPAPPPAGGVPRAGGPIIAPWDTAAQSMESRRQHVYPEGESEISHRLLASIPEPGRSGANAPPPPPPAQPKPAPPDPDSCWEVQILSTAEKSRAERVRDEAERELGIAAWVKSADGLHRVRIGGCLTPEGALELASRARDRGWSQAFRVQRSK
jgi:hypothetical protein